MIEVTKTISWDMGHRVPNHKSKCRNPHGHRYRLEMTFSGPVINTKGTSDEGMVMDFGDIKQIMMEQIHDIADHGFMVYNEDGALLNGLCNPYNGVPHNGWNVIKVPFIPTAENIVKWCVDRIAGCLPLGVLVTKARLYETPNSWADWTGDNDE